MTHPPPGGPESATPSILLSPTLSTPSIPNTSRGLDRDRLRDAIAARRRNLAHLEMTLATACERAAARHATRTVRIDDRATWDSATWHRYLAAATRLEPDYMPTMRRLLCEIEQLERLLSLPAQPIAA